MNEASEPLIDAVVEILRETKTELTAIIRTTVEDSQIALRKEITAELTIALDGAMQTMRQEMEAQLSLVQRLVNQKTEDVRRLMTELTASLNHLESGQPRITKGTAARSSPFAFDPIEVLRGRPPQ